MEPSLLKDKTVVVADDCRINVELLSMIVEGAGASVFTAFDGKQCVEIIRQRQIDMILMDKNMPVMDGLDASRAIRNLPGGKDVVIVGITGSDDPLEVNECKQAGMDMVCGKSELNVQKLYEIGVRYFGNQENDAKGNVPQPVRATPDAACSAGPAGPMDFPKALREFEDDRELLCSLMREFGGICREKMELMRNAFATADYDCIRRESHGIKGGAANLCALPLSDAAGLLERACKQQAERAVVASLLDQMTHCVTAFEAFVNTA